MKTYACKQCGRRITVLDSCVFDARLCDRCKATHEEKHDGDHLIAEQPHPSQPIQASANLGKTPLMSVEEVKIDHLATALYRTLVAAGILPATGWRPSIPDLLMAAHAFDRASRRSFFSESPLRPNNVKIEDLLELSRLGSAMQETNRLSEAMELHRQYWALAAKLFKTKADPTKPTIDVPSQASKTDQVSSFQASRKRQPFRVEGFSYMPQEVTGEAQEILPARDKNEEQREFIINTMGHLKIVRPNPDVPSGAAPVDQYCPVADTTNGLRRQCGDWCPKFGFIRRRGEVSYLQICDHRVLFGKITDLRLKVKSVVEDLPQRKWAVGGEYGQEKSS